MLRNLYCVTKTLCKPMISLPMDSLLKIICENKVTLLTQSRLISRVDAVEMVVVLEESHLPGQIQLVTNVVKRAISIKTAGQQDMVLVVTHPIIP